MPTYSYRCTECDNAFDIQQAFSDDTLTVCPTCQGVLRKVFSPIGVSFTGSGFYRTDSRAAQKSEKSSSSSSTSSPSSSSSSNDSGSTSSSSSSDKPAVPKKEAAKPAAASKPAAGGSTS